jgi:hypothetical protein
MLTELKKILTDFERDLMATNQEREDSGGIRLGFCEIKLLGQFSLLASRDKSLSQINIPLPIKNSGKVVVRNVKKS